MYDCHYDSYYAIRFEVWRLLINFYKLHDLDILDDEDEFFTEIGHHWVSI